MCVILRLMLQATYRGRSATIPVRYLIDWARVLERFVSKPSPRFARPSRREGEVINVPLNLTKSPQ